jgi:hypothetical protein
MRWSVTELRRPPGQCVASSVTEAVHRSYIGRMRLLAAVFLLVILTIGAQARADDYGPRNAVRSARDASTDLLQPTAHTINHLASANGIPQTPLIVYDVVTDGNASVASWRVADARGIIVLERRLGLWWKVAALLNDKPSAQIWTYTPTDQMGKSCPPADDLQVPTQSVLLSRYELSPGLVASAIAHNAILSEIDARAGHQPLVATSRPSSCTSPFSQASQTDGYRSSFELSVPDPPSGAAISRFTVRAPTSAEFPPTPGANSYYFFSFEFGGASEVQVRSGSLDVAFPFVLDPGLRYSLTIGFTKPVLNPIVGRLSDNELHFDLPPFTADPGTSLMGEIEGDPH